MVFPLWKIEYLDNCTTAIRAYYEKGGYHGRQTCIVDVGKAVSL